jgi:hypothetical protein
LHRRRRPLLRRPPPPPALGNRWTAAALTTPGTRPCSQRASQRGRVGRRREGERDRERKRESATGRERGRERQGERETERERHTQRERQRQGGRERASRGRTALSRRGVAPWLRVAQRVAGHDEQRSVGRCLRHHPTQERDRHPLLGLLSHRCVSMFLDKTRRHIGKSQSKRRGTRPVGAAS